MNITHLRSIDMARRMPMVPVDAVQGDGNTRILRLKLLENGESWTVPDGVTGAVAFRKPDGTKGLYDTLPDGTKAVTMEGSTVSAVLAPQVLTCAGEVSAAVVFHDDKLNQLAAFPILIRVAANPAAGQSVSNDYYRYSTMAEVSQAVEAALASLEEGKEDFLAKAEEALAVVHDTATEDAPAIVCEASGESITVADAANRPLKGLSIYGKTVQNGTPTPDAPVPLESVGESIGVDVRGKNLVYAIDKLQTKTVGGITFTPVYRSDGLLDHINVNGTCTATNWSDFDLLTAAGNTKAALPKGETITLHGGTSTVSLCIEGSVGVTDQGAGRTTTLTGDQYWAVLRVWAGRTVNNEKIYPMLNLGDTALEYEPPKPRQTFTASAPGGLHGIGEIKDEIDFTKVRVQRINRIVLSGEEKITMQTDTNGAVRFVLTGLPLANQIPNSQFCSHAVFKYNGNDVFGAQNAFSVYPEGWLFMNLNNCQSVDAFKALLAQQYANGTPVTVQYILAEPIETPLTAEEVAQFATLHSNKPNTTVFNDAGAEMKLSYVADTKLYIDQKLAAISAAMLG